MTEKYIKSNIQIRRFIKQISVIMWNFMMYTIPCCGPELGVFALGEEDGLSVPVLSASVCEVDVFVINWVVKV